NMDLPYHQARGQPARPELSNDIWLMIIEWIFLQSDIKSLCLVSRTLNALATPRLYDAVKIPLWDEKAVATFLRSVGTGAGRHLNRTRHLILESEQVPNEAFSILTGSLGGPEPRRIVRVDSGLEGAEDDADPVHIWLEAVLNSSSLETLHLSCDDGSPLEYCIPTLSIRAPNLLTFGYHNGPNLPEHGSEYLPEPDLLSLHKILSGFPKLQALGWKIEEDAFVQGDQSRQLMDDAFMEALQGVPDLRILHLRQANYLYRERYDEKHKLSDETFAFYTHRWANAFFDYMDRRKWSTKLSTLIIRCYTTDAELHPRRYSYSPQQCFVKGYQTDVLGRSAAVAIPVPRQTMKAIEPRADLLDYDPECNIFGEKFADSRRR
ncbi:hypothetical protein FB567DRAFT_452372, partial [Paraphoma chrysanthemicola]